MIDISKITIENNREQLEKFIDEIIIQPKKTLKEWSIITRQTPSFKLGYVGQHLASLITGVKGSGSGARGDDLVDATEVKSCNKIDQVDKCKVCGERVLRYENVCPSCGSSNLDRKNDSKWLFSIRSEAELEQYKNLDRLFLLIMDYPNFTQNDFSDIQISSFEIYPKEESAKVFTDLINNHYYNIYLPKVNEKNKANPMNFHPYSYQFYKCNPIQTFNCIIHKIDTEPKIDIQLYVDPLSTRGTSIDMPTKLLKDLEWDLLINNVDYKLLISKMINEVSLDQFKRMSRIKKSLTLPFIDEEIRDYLPLREIISASQTAQYNRR